MAYITTAFVAFALGGAFGAWLIKHPEDARGYFATAKAKISALFHRH